MINPLPRALYVYCSRERQHARRAWLGRGDRHSGLMRSCDCTVNRRPDEELAFSLLTRPQDKVLAGDHVVSRLDETVQRSE